MVERVRVGCRSRWSGTLRLRSGCRHQSPRARPLRSRARQVQLWSSAGHMRVLPHQHCPLCGHRRTWRHTRESCLLARLHQPGRFLLLRIFGNSKLTMVWWLRYSKFCCCELWEVVALHAFCKGMVVTLVINLLALVQEHKRHAGSQYFTGIKQPGQSSFRARCYHCRSQGVLLANYSSRTLHAAQKCFMKHAMLLCSR